MKIKVIFLAAVIAFAGCTTQIPPEEDCSDFVVLTDAVPDAILEIRYYSTYNFVGTRVDGYEEPIALCTKQAAQALRNASDKFVSLGYRIKVFDAYRPQKAVSHFCRWAADLTDTLMRSEFYPELSKDVLIPQDYICERSGHSRGSTVDLTLFDIAAGREVDMGGTFDYFGDVSHIDVVPGGPSGKHTPITEEQYRLRMLLREVMLECGFNGYDCEWWHFTLADEPFPDTYFTFPNTSKVFCR